MAWWIILIGLGCLLYFTDIDERMNAALGGEGAPWWWLSMVATAGALYWLGLTSAAGALGLLVVVAVVQVLPR
jgi:hypothetical protein